MRVLINRWSTFGNKTGVGHYCQQLLDHLRHMDGATITSFPSENWHTWSERFQNLARRLRALKPHAKRRWLRPLGIFKAVFLLERRAKQLMEKVFLHLQRRAFFGGRFDLYHEPNFIPLPSTLPTVTTLHDLSVILHPEWHPAERVKWYEAHFARSLTQSCHFLAVSQFTRRQIQDHLGIPLHKVSCVHNGVSAKFQPLPAATVSVVLRRHGLPSRFLLAVGTIEPRKNLLLLMRAYCSLPEELRRDCPLLLVGPWGWNIEREQEYFHREARHRGVLHFGYLPDHDLPALYNAARALLYPSLYEGFGLPPLEMTACGGAVIASEIEAIVETLGAGPCHLVAPTDFDGWREAMRHIIVDDDWRYELRRGTLELARRFSWQRSAENTAKVYRKILQPTSISSGEDGRSEIMAA